MGMLRRYLLFSGAAAALGFGGATFVFVPLFEPDDASLAQLPERAEDVVSWATLAQVAHRSVNGRAVRRFGRAVTSLDGKEIKLAGFMVPFDLEDKHIRFLLSASPRTCFDCWNRGPEGWVEVIGRFPIGDTYDRLVVSGRFAVVADSESLYYRLLDAVQVGERR